jgi:hypothetical protein
LQVYTREAYPAQWAMMLNNPGNAYSDLQGGDRQTNLERAIGSYEAALQTCRTLRLDHYAQVIGGNLEIARSALQALQ